MAKNDIVKNDINFLEYPIWVLSKVEGNQVVIEKDNGTYKLKSPERLPTDTDMLLLYYILSKAFDPATGECKSKVETSRYDIAMNVYNTRNTYIYNRILESLTRWTAIFIHFKGLFYDGKGFGTMGFHFVDSFKMDESTNNKLHISFNQEFINHLNTTKYFRYVSFEELKRLKRPVSRRLFELLLKTFKDRDVWSISTDKLTEKLTLSEKYPSQLLKKLKPAINEINNNTELSVELDTYRNNENETIVRFRKRKKKLEDASEQTKVLQTSICQNDRIWVRDLIPEYQRGPLVFALIDAYAGDDRSLVSNIRYVNSRPYDNYLRYLTDSLSNNWGLELMNEENAMLEKHEEIVKTVSEKLFAEHNVDKRIGSCVVLDVLKETVATLGDDRFFSADYVIKKIRERNLEAK